MPNLQFFPSFSPFPAIMDKQETSLDAYFASKTPLRAEDLLPISQALTAIQSHSASKLSTKRRLKPRNVSIQSFDSPIKSLTAKHQLVFARRQEKDLKDRLTYISSQIEEMTRHPSAPHLRIASNRNHSDSADSRATANTSKPGEHTESKLARITLLRKLKREQTERQRKMQSSLEAYKEKVEAEEREMRRREEERRKKQREGIVEELKKRHEEESARKQELKRIKAETDRKLQEIKTAQPLYEVLEDQYNTNVRLPESLRQQALLARKRPHVSLQDIIRHSKETELREEAETAKRRRKRAQKQAEMQQFAKDLHFYRPKAADVIEEEEEMRRRKAAEKAESVRRLQARKQHYGLIVRELINTQRKSHPSKPLPSSSRSTRSIPKPRPSHYYHPHISPIRPRKSHSTQSLPDPISPPKPKNYLNHLRLTRKSSSASHLPPSLETSKWRDLLNSSASPAHLTKVHKEALRIEAVARSHELRLGDISNWKEAVDTHEAVTSLYVDAIKAKIAVLTAM